VETTSISAGTKMQDKNSGLFLPFKFKIVDEFSFEMLRKKKICNAVMILRVGR
jgi:hypothetical protein